MAGSGCTLPEHLRVETGKTPQYADKDVRFRTTYYFRVFDYCYDVRSKSDTQPVTDSLYRFVMTGKANAYGNEVRFESGTLKASDIDPFGATVEYDENTGRFRFVPEAEVQAEARRNRAEEEIEALVRLKRRLMEMRTFGDKAELPEGATRQDVIDDTTIKALDTQIKNLVNLGLAPQTITTTQKLGDAEQVLVCPAGSEVQRGFQIMGPEGIKTFDQDERLIMAMSASGQPIISALKELSGRFLKAEEAKRGTADILLPLTLEQLRVSKMERETELFDAKGDQTTADDVKQLTRSVAELLDGEEEK